MNRELQQEKAGSLWKQGNLGGAISILTRLAKTYPNDPALWGNLGVLHSQMGNVDLSIECYKKTLSVVPDSENAHCGIAMMYGLSGSQAKAHFHFSTVISINPNNIEANVKLAVLEFFGGNIPEALRRLTKVESINPNHLELNVRLAEVHTALNAPEKAAKYLQKANLIQPNNPEVIQRLASRHVDLGEVEEAYNLIKPFVESHTPFISATLLLSDFCSKIEQCSQCLEALQKLLVSGISRDDEMRICFAIGNLLDQNKKYKKAFTYYKRANDLYSKKYDYSSDKEWLATVKFNLGRDFFTNGPKANIKHKIQPIFIIGMPRSGTSLIEQIISSHPDVHGAGERYEIDNIASSLTALLDTHMSYPASLTKITQSILNKLAGEYIESASDGAIGTSIFFTDKMPHNFMHLGLIKLLFPKARIIHCTRSAIDTCLSNYFTQFRGAHEYSYNIESLAQKYLLYNEMMQYWKSCLDLDILDLRYEELIASPEKITQKLIDYCGLKWSDNCLSFHTNKRAVVTASRGQVRQQLYSRSINRWKNYEQESIELRKTLSSHLESEYL